MKPDHVIGLCYRDYLRQAGDVSGDPADPCGREHVPADDLANCMLERWRAGDSETRALWTRVCGLVEQGHADTLDRLGVPIDGCWRESDDVGAAIELIKRGVEQNVLTREASGMVVYDSGREEYRRIVLARSDGFPTEHGRVLAVYHRILTQFKDGCEHIDWSGTEWEPAQKVLCLLMEALSLVPAGCVHRTVFHGMVLFEGKELSSSEGEPPLIDTLVDRVSQSPEIAACLGPMSDPASRNQLAGVVVKTFFLCVPLAKPLVFSWLRLMDPQTNPGWTVARAMVRAAQAAEEATAEVDLASGPYRTSVLQALNIRRDLALAARQARLSGLTKFLIQYSDRFVESPPCPRLDRVSRTLLGQTLRSLGLLRASHQFGNF